MLTDSNIFSGILRASVRAASVFVHLSTGIVVTSILRLTRGRYWYATNFGRNVVLWWTKNINRIIGIRIVKYGEIPVPHALYVANHISFFDIIVIAAITPTTFISKNAVRYWPLIGQLSSLAGVVFIKRGKRNLIARIIDTAATALDSGGSLTVFPEGTTHFSNEPGKFHAGLYQAAINSQTPIQAIALAYIRDGGHDRSAAYVEGDNILITLFHIMSRPHTNVHVFFCPVTNPSLGNRNQLAQHTRQQIIDARNNTSFVETHWVLTRVDHNLKVNYLRFNIDIANEEYLNYYSGHAQSISVQTEDGMRVEFPAMHLREFVSHSGVQGYFELCFDAQNRFQSIRRIN